MMQYDPACFVLRQAQDAGTLSTRNIGDGTKKILTLSVVEGRTTLIQCSR